jgi:ABC-type polysaccharide/polyol phosphate transport system ATPase subunit
MNVAVLSAPAASQAAEPVDPLLIEATHVGKKYCRDLRRSLRYGVQDVLDALLLRPRDPLQLRRDEFWAVDDASLVLRRGESLGLIGHNGSGKSTLLKLITGQRKLTTGRVVTQGRIVALTHLGLGFDPLLTGRENIYINAAVFGVLRDAVKEIIDDIVAFAGIGAFIDAPVGTYSSGMMARLGFATAAHLDPDIFIVDEVLAVGDVAFRRKCIQHVAGYLKRGGSLVLVAHDPHLIQSICNRCIVLENGRIVFDGPALEGVKLHFQSGHALEQESAARAARRATKSLHPPPVAGADTAEPGETVPAAAAEPASMTDSPRIGQELSATCIVVIDRFEVLPLGPQPLVPGSPAKVVLHYRSRVAMHVVWAFSFCTSNMQTTISTSIKGFDGCCSRLLPGEHQFECMIPKLPLRAGTYSIRGGICECDPPTFTPLTWIGWDDAPDFFSVVPIGATREVNLQMLFGDLVHIDVEWLS